MATVSPNYVADWCGKRAPDGYEAFRTALADYRAAIEDVVDTNAGVIGDLAYTCRIDGPGATGPKPADPVEVDLIVQRLSFSGRPAVDRAAAAWNRMKAAQKQAFAGDPQAPAVAVDIDALQGMIEGFGRGIMMLETAGELYAQCTTWEAWLAASGSLAQATSDLVDTGQENVRITGDIQMAFQATQDACTTVRVRERIPASQIKKVGAPTTKKSGGAAVTFPKTLDVGKKPVKLPVNVTRPGSGYGTVTVTRGSKGVVATGGWMEPGTFGLLMTVPGGTKTGKVTVTVTQDGGATVKGTIALRSSH